MCNPVASNHTAGNLHQQPGFRNLFFKVQLDVWKEKQQKTGRVHLDGPSKQVHQRTEKDGGYKEKRGRTNDVWNM